MKKIKFLTGMILIFILSCINTFAQFPTVNYSREETAQIVWGETTKIGSYEPGEVYVTVKISSDKKEIEEYLVTYSSGENKPVTTAVEVPPGEEFSKKININVPAGIHDVAISVLKDGKVLCQSEKNIKVIKSYTGEFMDELSGRGINVHYMWDPYNRMQIFVNDLLELSGLKVARDGYAWEAIEKSKRTYDFSAVDKYTSDAVSKGISTYWCTSYGAGKLYPPARGLTPNDSWDAVTRFGFPQTQESIQGYTDYAQEIINHFKKNNYSLAVLETWNEMNSEDQKGATQGQIFTDFIRPIKIKSILNGNDDVDIGTFTPHIKNYSEFLHACMQSNFYPMFDRYAAHEYVHGGGFEETNEFQLKTERADDLITEYGGWKKSDITETGFYTITGPSATATLESAADEIPKTFVICEYSDMENIIIYDLINDGREPTYSEHNFGAVTYDGELKPHYLSMTNFNNQTSGAILLGEIDTRLPDGTRAFMYYKDGEPVVIAWANNEENAAVEWDLSGESVTLIENYGNVTHTQADSVVLTESPVYIKNLDRKWIAATIYNEVSKKNAEWLGEFSDGVPADVLESLKATFKQAEDMLSDYSVTEQEALEIFRQYMQEGYGILKAGSDGTMEEVEVSKRLYRLYRIAERLNSLYITLYSGETPTETENRYDESYKKSRTYLDEVKIKQYSDAMLRFAKYYNDDIAVVQKSEDNPSKAGVIKAWDLMAEELCGWYDVFYEFETISNIYLTLQTPNYDRESYVNSDITSELNLNNYGKEDFVGTICAYDTEGNKVGETSKLTVPANGGYVQTSITINTTKPQDNSGITYYNFSYVDTEGNVLYTLRQAYEVSDRYDVQVLPCKDTIENLKNISFKITNKTNTAQNAHIKLESDENFEFAYNEITESIAANEEKIVSIPIKRIEDVKYHLYSFKYTVTDDEGNVVAERDAMIDFSSVIKSDKEISVADFDGSIEDWEDAYPIYINVPVNSSAAESWQNAECSARAFMKWDEEHLYLLVDVYDELYLQTASGADMWKGDSIQFAIDPLNDGGIGYQADDFELGFSVTPAGQEWNAWQSPNGLTGGTDDWYKIVRNDDLRFTRYLISMDSEILGSVAKLSEGTTYGINLLINDNDYLSREGYYEFTYGIGYTKVPGDFADFTMIANENNELKDGYAAELFPVKVEAVVSDRATYSDTEGHWAEAVINAMSFNGYVSGMDDGSFMPDSDVTRAEFFSILSRAAELEGDNTKYSDVDKNDWFASAVSGVGNLIPEAMAENNAIFPDKQITRQEAVYLIAAVYTSRSAERLTGGDVMAYPDGENVASWAVEMVNKALAKKLIRGDADGNLYPEGLLTRAEATVMIYNLLDALPKE